MTDRAVLPLGRVGITDRTAVSAAGRGRAAHVDAMAQMKSGLTPCDYPGADLDCYIGRVAGIEDDPFPQPLSAWDNRCNRLALAGLRADGFDLSVARARERWGAARVGLIVGTSTSGVERLETVYRARPDDAPLARDYSLRHHSDHHASTSFLIEALAISGPAYTISTACSSSAKAVVDAAQLIQTGLSDAVIVIGVDSLCLTSLYGFEALELLSRQPARPMDADRDGLSIGEGAGLLLLERDAEGPRLLGYGESSDAVSMSTPPPDGSGAAQAMRGALSRAGLQPSEIGFVKLHGTATRINDLTEATALSAVFPDEVPAASFKGLIGHTLGAAGALEAVMCLDAMQHGLLPGNAGLSRKDPEITREIPHRTRRREYTTVICNAFGFGGSNCALLLARF